jgi:endonuclease/exonuclease/phosphatase family metal-dependent hydrolase
LDPIFSALATGANPIPAASAAWATVQATDFPSRAIALADEIAVARPDLIGLQEVFLWRYGPRDSIRGGTPAETIAYDFLQSLQDELAARGLAYRVASEIQHTDMELPALDPVRGAAFNNLVDVRATDRDVILVRDDLLTGRAAAGHFVNLVPIPGTAFSVLRGWVSVEVKFRGEWLRFVNSHPEPHSVGGGFFNAAQLSELIAELDGAALPVVLAGDLNAPATVPGSFGSGPYLALLTQGGFTDAWLEVHPTLPGLTCCYSETLTDASSTLDERIDLILYRGPFRALSAELYGEDPADRIGNLWPSDHAGVGAEIRIADERFAR